MTESDVLSLLLFALYVLAALAGAAWLAGVTLTMMLTIGEVSTARRRSGCRVPDSSIGLETISASVASTPLPVHARRGSPAGGQAAR